MAAQLYLVALGSNRPHARYGAPRAVLTAACTALTQLPAQIIALAPTLTSAPVGPSLRQYANSAVIIETGFGPAKLMSCLKQIERSFGRRPGGQRWSSRVLDLDIILWSGGSFHTSDLTIPHPAFRQRSFVLQPAMAIAPCWKDPVTNLSLRQLHARLTRRAPPPRGATSTRNICVSGP
ncbi:MAG: 2-amino-4-hydroxy-6-hydroxymethyldihydropteridine diphosphokinase [Sphingomonadaceae bacterium]